MTYCDECANQMSWPIAFSKLVAVCQVCGNCKYCTKVRDGVVSKSTRMFSHKTG